MRGFLSVTVYPLYRRPGAAFYHDIFLTENYVIVPETSLRKDIDRIKQVIIKGGNV